MSEMDKDVTQVIYTSEQIQERISEIAAQVSRDYQGEDLIVVCILKGAVFFMADLVRALTIPAEIDFMAVSSYGSAAKSSGTVRIQKDLKADIAGRNVLIAEDILDTGITLSNLLENLRARNPRSLEVAALLRKEGAQQAHIDCRYEGLPVPDGFIVGFGLDYAERYRNLPYVGMLDPQVYGG